MFLMDAHFSLIVACVLLPSDHIYCSTVAIFTKINLQHCTAIGAAGGVNSANLGEKCAQNYLL